MKIIKYFIITLGIISLLITLISLGAFAIIKHLKIKDIVEREIEQQLGINVTIKKVGYSPFLTHIFLEGVTIHNPDGFKEKELAYLNSIHLVWDPGDMIILKKPNIYLCGIDLERLNIIKNKQGKVNIEELMPVKDGGSAPEDNTPFFFDVLVLSIAKVTYTEYTYSGTNTHSFLIGMKDQTFVNLQDENKVVKLIIYKAIQNTDIAKMINLTIMPGLSGVSDTIGAAWGTAKIGVKSAFQIAFMPFKLVFGK
jgi:hypothetical protein